MVVVLNLTIVDVRGQSNLAKFYHCVLKLSMMHELFHLSHFKLLLSSQEVLLSLRFIVISLKVPLL